MDNYNAFPPDGTRRTSIPLSRGNSGVLGERATLAPEEAAHTSSSRIEYHGEALARIPSLERVGGPIVVGFTVIFAAFLLTMNLAGQVPGQSFLLKSISDCLQFVGECIGLYFSTVIALRIRRTVTRADQKLRALTVDKRPSNSEIAAARLEARNVRQSYWAWILLSLAIGVYATGQAIWTSYDVRMPSASVPFPGLYDIGFVAAYPFFIAGALLLTRRSNRGATVGRVRILLDALLVIGAAFSLSWFFILGPSVAGLAQQPGFGAAFLAIYFPGGDLLLVALGAFLMFSQSSTRERQAVFVRLCMGLFFLAVTDSILVWLSLSSSFNTGTIQDILWPLSMQMVGLAAIAYPRSLAQEQERAAQESSVSEGSILTRRLSAISLYIQTAAPFILALGTSAILLTAIPETAKSEHLAASIIALCLFVFVAVRQTLTLNENNRLRLQLAGELVLSRRELQVSRREAEAAQHEVQVKQQLEQGVMALRAVHVRISHGDFSVRASTEPGPLQAIAVSLNLMIERLKDLALRASYYDQLTVEIRLLQGALERLGKGMAAWPTGTSANTRTELQGITIGIERVQRFQEDQWKSLLLTLERLASPLGRLREYREDNEERGAGPVTDQTIQQTEQHLQKLIEQTRVVIERLENKKVPGAPNDALASAQAQNNRQRLAYAEQGRRPNPSHPLQSRGEPGTERPSQTRPRSLSRPVLTPEGERNVRGGRGDDGRSTT